MLLCASQLIRAQSQGPNSAGTGTNVSITGIAWSNPGNISISDNNYASVNISNSINISDALVASNFGFSIPLTATIDSIKVGIERYYSGTGLAIIVNWILQLTKDGTNPVGTNQYQLQFWTTAESTYNYSDSSSLWGTTWTPAEINSSNFGVYIRVGMVGFFGNATAYIDNITATVYYSVPTPVELLSFNGDVMEEVIQLQWKTTREVRNDFYTLEKSSNGLNYVKLATIEGNGTTEFISNYTYIDPLPFSGNNYYRLMQTDFDGSYEIFKPIMVHYEKEGAMMKVYPNPTTNDFVNLIVNPDLLKGEGNNTYIIVRSLSGEIVHQQLIPTINLGDRITMYNKFNSGIYIIELHSPNGISTQKIVVN